MRLVLALGGNALLDPEAPPGYESQIENIRQTASRLVTLLDDGHELAITHGNGPQVGNIMLQEERTPPKMPLDVDVAETQGQIGYLLQREIGAMLSHREEGCRPATLVTQVIVDEDDAAFDEPSKPVGPFYTEEEAQQAEGTIKKIGSGEKPYRRVVPSPKPRRIVERETIASLLSKNRLVIACGGGGIPITKEGEGIEAVVDKDRSAALLAEEIDAERLLILTDVPHVCRDFGTDQQEAIEEMNVEEAVQLAEKGVFGEGSMEPKVRAAARFVEATGRKAIIGSLHNMGQVLEGKGTVVKPT
jgi:carbamate kinase